MHRSARSTQIQLADWEAQQTEVIALVNETGNGARRLSRCQHDRQHRQRGRYPWRCRSAGCWACRRNMMRRWWLAVSRFLIGPTVTLVVIPVDDQLIAGMRRLRKALRDVRDRVARHHRRWRSVAMAGLADGDRALVLIEHAGIGRTEVHSVLARRWPLVTLHDAHEIVPNSCLSVADAADLARRKRGIEGLRIVIMPQRGSTDGRAEAMPFILS
jgi:hypothetical protein